MKINILKHKEINYQHWDNCISNSKNELIYAYSWYLDVVCPQWEAIIGDDYKYVMPLPVKKKYGISFLAQPVLTQQLGIFSPQPIPESVVHEFTKKIPYISYDLNLNECNNTKNSLPHPNFKLNLNKKYESLYQDYSSNTKRNIKKASASGISLKSDINIKEYLDFYYNRVEANFEKAQYPLVLKLLQAASTHNALELYGTYNNREELIAALALLKTENQLTYLLPGSSAEGKKESAMFAIIDGIIRKYAGNNMLFDFEGSRINGIARFYQGFGGINKPYFQIQKRSIPALLKKLKLR